MFILVAALMLWHAFAFLTGDDTSILKCYLPFYLLIIRFCTPYGSKLFTEELGTLSPAAAVWLVLNLGESRCYRNQLESNLGLDEESKDEMKYGLLSSNLQRIQDK